MKLTMFSFQSGVAALAVVFALVAMPFISAATETIEPVVDTPTRTLPGLTTETLTIEPIRCSLTLDHTEIVTGGSVTVSWETSGADEITVNGEVVPGDSGSMVFSNITENTTFELVAKNQSGGVCKGTATVTCLPSDIPMRCEDFGYDFEIGKFEWNGQSFAKESVASGYDIKMSGDSHQADWTSQPAVAGVLAKAATVVEGFDGGNSGSITKTEIGTGKHGISNVVFCAKKEEPKGCELTLNKKTDKTDAKPGDVITYDITIESTGDSKCTGGGVKIYDVVDHNVQFLNQTVSSNLSPGYGGSDVYTEGDRTIRWNGHDLDPGEKGYITWTGKVKTPAKCGDFVVYNKAKATAKELNNFKDWSHSNEVKTNIDNDCSTPTPPECPIEPAPDRIIVDFGDERLRSDQGISEAQTALQSFNVPAGKYDIRLVSYDGYIGRENMTQNFEQYQLQFLNNGNEVGLSSAISDLADKVTEATNDEVVNQNFMLSTDATELRAVHAFFGDTSSANSLNPICASIDPVDPEPEVPSCDFFTATPSTITLGEEVLLEWGTTNAVTVAIDNGIGKVNPDGSVKVSPLVDTLYTMTVFGTDNQTVSCEAKVVVKEDETPSCDFFTANPMSIDAGETVTLSWGTTNASQVSINNGVGNVAQDGSVAVTPTEDTLYVLTALGGNGVVNDDLNIMRECFFGSATGACAAADFSGNDIVNFEDLALLKSAEQFDFSGDNRVDVRDADDNEDLNFMKKCFFGPATGDCAAADLDDDGVVNFVDLGLFKSATKYDLSGDLIVDLRDDSGSGQTDKCTVEVKVDSTPERPVCPFTPGEDVTIFEFNEKIRSDDTVGNSQTNIQATNLEPGKYDIFLASWDSYPSRVNVTQPNEQWQLQLLDGNEMIGISGAISDLPDRVASAFLEEQVNDAYELVGVADGVRAVHAVFPDKESANSVDPICAAVVKQAEPAPSCDLFTATPNIIMVGDNTTLNWETSNATRVVINNGIGEVDPDGSLEVSPLADIIYQMTVFGAEDQSVDCEVKVAVSEDPVPVCKLFTATPGNLPAGGGDVVLNWEVEKASSVTISPTVGAVTLTGSATVAVTESTNFSLTAVDSNGDEVTCDAPVTVPDPVVFTCENNVTFDATPNSVRSGSEVILDWNVTGADSVFISEINETAFSGTTSVRPSTDTTYVLAATLDNETIECPTSVTISRGGGGGGSSSPRCELDISDEQISLGEEIVLTWDTSRTNDVMLTDDLGNVIFSTEDMLAGDKEEYEEGSIALAPTRDTEYTLTAKRGSRDQTCRVSVELEDDIVIIETRDQQPLVAGISLSSVPYTGFEAGPFMTVMFYVLLGVWAFSIAYLIVTRKQTPAVSESEMTTAAATMKAAEETRPDVFVQSVATPQQVANSTTPANLPVSDSSRDSAVVTDTVVASIEDRAHSQKALLSSDAIRHFVATTEGEVERNQALDQVIAEAKKAYPLEDGWIVINESRMQNLCEVCKVHAAEAPKSFAPTKSSVPEGSSSLAEAIVTGNVVAAYEMIGTRPMFALADAAADLDAVYRNRKGENHQVSELLASETQNLSDEKIKSMISSLTSALDGTYTDEASAVKMAIMKAVKEIS